MDIKIFLTYKDQEGRFAEESIWGEKNGETVRVKNIPFFAENVAYNDLISVELDEGVFYYEDLLEASNHSTLHVVLFDIKYSSELTTLIEHNNCSWEGSHVKTYIAIDVPQEVQYHPLKQALDKGCQENKWDYKEACLGQGHKSETVQ